VPELYTFLQAKPVASSDCSYIVAHPPSRAPLAFASLLLFLPLALLSLVSSSRLLDPSGTVADPWDPTWATIHQPTSSRPQHTDSRSRLSSGARDPDWLRKQARSIAEDTSWSIKAHYGARRSLEATSELSRQVSPERAEASMCWKSWNRQGDGRQG
jgi:hypothetical protein